MIGSAPEETRYADALGSTEAHAASGIAFWSAPLALEVTLVGQPRLRLAYALDCAEADIAAAVLVTLPSGRRLTLAGTVRRLKHAAADPMSIVDLEDFGVIARALPVGARIGLMLRSVVSISYQRCDHLGGATITAPIHQNAKTARVRVHIGARDLTTLSLPMETSA